MARRKNDRPTLIYWLIDCRPEVLPLWPNGLPFYCGKTVLGLTERMAMHLHDATRVKNRPSAIRMRECGTYVRIQQMATVSCEDDWAAAERRWIWVLRSHFPNTVNVSDGGTGCPGQIHTDETRMKISKAKVGKPKTAEHKAKLSAANLGKTASAETREKMRVHKTGSTQSPESRAKLSKARKGMKFSESHIANLRAALTGRKLSPEHAAKVRRTLVPKQSRAKAGDAQCLSATSN